MPNNQSRKDVPIIAFFGTKGGVGKTTITSRFSEFLTQSFDNPNVLMIDFDVDHRGLTVLWTQGIGFSCKTIHEYISEKTNSLEDVVDVTYRKKINSGGNLYLIPAAHADSKEIFATTANLTYSILVSIIIELIKEAIVRYDISCVVIDCGPIINPYTAAAAHISDNAFIIGQNEPISYESLSNYSYKIKEFYEDFNSSKMSIILNKVRGDVREGFNVFAVIPFTMEIIDLSEGIENINQMRISLFENHVLNIISKLFHTNHPSYIPDKSVILSDEMKYLGQNAHLILKSKYVKLLSAFRFLFTIFAVILFLGILYKIFFNNLENKHTFDFLDSYINTILIVISVITFIFYLFRKKYYRIKKDINSLSKKGSEQIVYLMNTVRGRAKLEKYRKWLFKLKDKGQ